MSRLADLLAERFQHEVDTPAPLDAAPGLRTMAARGSCRSFEPREVPTDVLRALAAVAMASPTKSDLQQRDIVIVTDPALRQELLALVREQAWTAAVPNLLVFCGNNRRQRQLHDAAGRAFANDHLDAFFNGAVDAGIALSAFVTAAEAIGLGCCPISTLRNRAEDVDRLLGLPEHTFPVAGLAVGYPLAPSPISQRLPLAVSVHENRLDDARFGAELARYDATRQRRQPYAAQRREKDLGRAETYGWSEDKARQYSLPERAGFGAYVRSKGFRLT